jgi:M6 family metalloprotease-like protein
MKRQWLTPRTWLALLALAGVLLALMAAHSTARAQSAGLSGTFVTVWSDGVPVPGPGGARPQSLPPQHFVVDGRGKMTEIAVDETVMARAGGMLALNGKPVTVTLGAAVAANGPRTAQEIRRAPAPSGGSGNVGIQQLDPGAPDVTGSKPYAAILCRFKNRSTDTPQQPSYYETLFGATRPGLDHYWREVSYNKINIAGTQVFGWFNLAKNESDYHVIDPATGQPKINPRTGLPSVDTGKLATDCAAAGDSQVNYANFKGVAVFFNGELDGLARGGSHVYTLDGATRTLPTIWINRMFLDDGTPVNEVHQMVVAHEMGHSFGLPHSSGPYNTGNVVDDTYDSQYDVMSAGGECDPFDADYLCLGVHTIAAHKAHLGWIPSNRIYSAPVGQAAPTLSRIAQPGSTGYLMAKIPIHGTTTQYYTVELRMPNGYDVQTPREGVFIHKVDETRGDRNAQLVDPDNDGDVNDASAQLIINETFTDTANGITVRVEAVDQAAGTARVSIRRDPFIAVNDVITQESTLVSPKATFTVRLNAASLQPVTVQYATANGTAVAPGDYTAKSGSVTIPAGQTSATVVVDVKLDSLKEVNETFFLNISNATNGKITDSQGKATVEDLPPPPPPSCPVLTPDCVEP